MNYDKRKWAVAICITSIEGQAKGFLIHPEVGLEFVMAKNQEDAQQIVSEPYLDKLGETGMLYVYAQEIKL